MKKYFTIIIVLVLISCKEKKDSDITVLKKALAIEEKEILIKDGISLFPVPHKRIDKQVNNFNSYLSKYSTETNHDSITKYQEKIVRSIRNCGKYGHSTLLIFGETEAFRDNNPEMFNYYIELTKLLYYKSLTNSRLGIYAIFPGIHVKKDSSKANQISYSLGVFNAFYPSFLTICNDTIYEDNLGVITVDTKTIEKTKCPVKFFYKCPGYYDYFEIK